MKRNLKELKKLHSFLTVWAEKLSDELDLYGEELDEEIDEEQAEETFTNIIEMVDAHILDYERERKKIKKFVDENFKYWSIG